MESLIKKQIKGYIDYYKAHDNIDEKLFWCIVPLSLIVGVISVICLIVAGRELPAVLSAFLYVLLSAVMIIICRGYNANCAGCYSVFCLILNCVVMPAIFITNGGMRLGIPMYCVGSIMLCAFCSDKSTRIRTFLISIAVMTCVMVAGIIWPGIVMPVSNGVPGRDSVITFVIVAFSMVSIIASAVAQINEQRYRNINNGLISSLGSIIEFRSLETGDHAFRIRKYTEILLKWANKTVPGADFSSYDISIISSASVLHDIGKIAIPDAILNKPGPLTAEEFGEIRKHPEEGCKMLETMRDFQNRQYYDYCYEICRHHHERYDGTGYPDGLAGDDIPLISQIVSLADVYDALTTERVYKKAYSPDAAFSIMKNTKGQFSQYMIRCLQEARPELDMVMKGDTERKSNLESYGSKGKNGI